MSLGRISPHQPDDNISDNVVRFPTPSPLQSALREWFREVEGAITNRTYVSLSATTRKTSLAVQAIQAGRLKKQEFRSFEGDATDSDMLRDGSDKGDAAVTMQLAGTLIALAAANSMKVPERSSLQAIDHFIKERRTELGFG